MRHLLFSTAILGAVSCGGEPSGGEAWQGTIEVVDGRTMVWNPPVGVWRIGARGRLIADLRIGSVEGDGPDMFGSIDAIAISNQGDIAILDAQAQEVRVFDTRGEYLRTVGRKGQGPGEFEGAVSVHYDGADRLWVVDTRNARYNLFSPAGEFLQSSQRSAGIVIGDPGMFTRLGLLDPFPRVTAEGEIQRLYVIVNTAGEIVDTLPPIASGQVSVLQGVPVWLSPFMPRITSTSDVDGDLWIASTDQYALFRRTPEGDTVQVIELEVRGRDLSPEEQDSIDTVVRNWRSPIDVHGLNLGAQVLRSLHLDEIGRVFVRPGLPLGEPDRVFDVFDEQGRYLGPVEADVTFEMRPRVLARQNAVYGVVLDDLDVPYLVRARLEEPRNPSEEREGNR